MATSRRPAVVRTMIASALLWCAAAHPVWAHGVSAADRTFMERGGLMAFLYLGAKHWSPATTTCCSSSA